MEDVPSRYLQQAVVASWPSMSERRSPHQQCSPRFATHSRHSRHLALRHSDPYTHLETARSFVKMADAEPSTMEEINAQRVAAGLAPIPVDDGTQEIEPDEDIVAGQNYAQRREEMKRAKEKKDMDEKISK